MVVIEMCLSSLKHRRKWSTSKFSIRNYIFIYIYLHTHKYIYLYIYVYTVYNMAVLKKV
uniref:Uncharacterized protein n=1 Tax=Anguilla anguilla TaxID=7936 RepID=A0A0E9X363_ANGAN